MKRAAALALLVVALVSPAPAQQAPSDVPMAGSEGVPVPKRTKSVMPEYPAAAQAQGLRGIVILQVLIDEQGKVASVDVVRSIPGLDEAAITAVRQWEYEPVKIDGRPTPVRLAVPITFLMKLPELAREVGVPELRQGAMPANPRPEGKASVTAQLTVDPDGQLVEAEIIQGESPFSEALLQALRTWAFVADAERGMLAFRLQAEFQPAERGKPAVTLAAGSVRHDLPVRTAASAPPSVASSVAPSAAPTDAPSAPPPVAAPAPPTEATPRAESPSPPAATPPAPAAAPSAVPAPQQQATGPQGASPEPAQAPGTPAPTAPAAAPAASGPAAPPSPSPRSAAPAPRTEASPTAAPPPSAQQQPKAVAPVPPPPPPTPTAVKQPATEVLRAPVGAQPGAPSGPGAPAEGPQSTVQAVSAVRDVLLGPGVPELAGGRRPVMPPLARLGGVSGVVSVRFSIDSGGGTQVASAEGPKPLEQAAREMVGSWRFRRLRPERLMAVAQVRYEADLASAIVNLEP